MNAGDEEIPPAPPLAPLHEGILDEATLDQLFHDLIHGTRVVEVLEKGQPHLRATGTVPDLTQCLLRLKQGLVRAVQIRYVHEDRLWSDVVMKHPEGYRVVRSVLPT